MNYAYERQENEKEITKNNRRDGRDIFCRGVPIIGR